MPKIIAIIDDEIEMEELYAVILDRPIADHKIKLKFFPEATSFLEWFKTHKPDLILSDISMPLISGLDLGRQIRKLGSNIPTYFVSGYDESKYSDLLKELGFCRYIQKPIDEKNVLRLMECDLQIGLS